MTDARWLDVEDAVAAAVRHFARAVELNQAGGFEGDTLDAYRAKMAPMHAVQAGHTSLEGALIRILEIRGEEAPTGSEWHSDLIKRAGRSIPGDLARPPILPPGLRAAADETRRFRHMATRAYDSFEVALAQPAIRACGVLASELGPAVTAFRRQTDPHNP